MGIKKYLQWIIPVSLAVAIKIFSFFPAAIESYYSAGIYPVISRIQRLLFGWLPFSVGDLFYLAAAIYLLLGIFRLIKALFKKELSKKSFLSRGARTLLYALWIYIVFNLSWGLNYNRLGIGQQLQLKPSVYSAGELEAVLNITIEKLNVLAEPAYKERPAFRKKTYLFKKAVQAYDLAATEFTFLQYSTPSVKPSLFSYLGNYLGYTGYYNPFSGEAQVNTTVPLFLQPFTSTHEIGHQLGYAKEMEANFAGYLAAKHSTDKAVLYSLYFDLYVYAIRNLYFRDSLAVKTYAVRLPMIAKNDIRELKAFFRKYENPFEPIIRQLYGQYLKANEQPQGILSYDEVLGWIIAYYRKFGEI